MSITGKKKFGFVILHYMTTAMTIKSTEQVLQNFGEVPNTSISIVIVDNASPNNSGTTLAAKYSNNSNINVILNKENLGFAQGNNMGYHYLRENFDPDFIIIMNNDVIIEQPDFLQCIDKIYSKNRFAVLGPDIYNPLTREHQSPLRITELTKKDFEAQRALLQKQERLFAYYYYRHLTLGKLKARLLHQSEPTSATVHWQHPHENVALQGACYIFSQEFIKRQRDAFFNKTFLYYEEEILLEICKQQKLKILYDPEIQVIHLEDVATNAAFKTKFKKDKMKNHEMLKSISMLLTMLTNNSPSQKYTNKK